MNKNPTCFYLCVSRMYSLRELLLYYTAKTGDTDDLRIGWRSIIIPRKELGVFFKQ
jgi:hypothetical protein